MQRVSIRAYAELNDFLPPGRRMRSFHREFDVSPSVKDLIESAGIPHTEVELVVVNGESVGFDHRVRDGDRIAVYPVFESLDVTPELKVRPAPLRVVRFVLDGHLGRLAAYLRLAGLDTLIPGDTEDSRLAEIARTERRILLTRDRGLLKRRAVTHGYCVRETVPRRQFVEVIRRFDLRRQVDAFSRCLACNGRIVEADAGAVRERVPAGVWDHQRQFRMCESCGRVYWQGSHHERMGRLLEDAVAEAGAPAATEHRADAGARRTSCPNP